MVTPKGDMEIEVKDLPTESTKLVSHTDAPSPVPGTGNISRHKRNSTTANGQSYGALTEDETPLVSTPSTFIARNPFGRRESKSSPADVKSRCLSSQTRTVLKHVKVLVLFLATMACTILMAVYQDETFMWHQLSVSRVQPHSFNFTDMEWHNPVLKLMVRGSFLLKPPSSKTQNITVSVHNSASNTTKKWVGVLAPSKDLMTTPETIETVNMDFSGEIIGDVFIVTVQSTAMYAAPIAVSYNFLSTEVKNQVIYATLILISVYVLIIFEMVHRTVAAMIGALASLAVLAAFNEKPSLDRVLEWLDYETLCLLFGMMVLVSIFCESGFFDYVALIAYKIAKGKTWPLITILCAFSAFISAFLDNVTTILLLSPVTIRLCEVLQLDPKHVLIAEVMFSNIGGTATAVGDPPNVIIVSNKNLAERGINFTTFTMHMAIGTVFVMVAAYILLRLIYRKKEFLMSFDPPEVAEIKHEIEIWRRASNKIVVATREESMVKALLMQKVVALENLANRKMYKFQRGGVVFKISVQELEKKYFIRDYYLLAKSGIVLIFVIICFFLSSFITQIHLTLGWVAILGAILLLVLADYNDVDSVLDRVEWSTLLFFAALFVMMEALTQLGLIKAIANLTTQMITGIDESSRLALAIIIIMWVSAVASSFIDNIPFTTAMVPVIIELSENKSVNLPLEPMVWALAFGACLGGNGTLVGASANVVCAGIAETHGHKFNFFEFFKIGFPMMLVTTFIAMCYLLLCHVAFGWNYSS